MVTRVHQYSRVQYASIIAHIFLYASNSLERLIVDLSASRVYCDNPVASSVQVQDASQRIFHQGQVDGSLQSWVDGAVRKYEKVRELLDTRDKDLLL